MGVSKAKQTVENDVITIDRRSGERRSGDAEALDTGDGATPRRKKQRRRHIDPTTCERDYSEQEIEFMRAMDDYKRDSGRMFPTCSEVLEVVRGLGYHQLTDDQIVELGLADTPAAEDESQDEELDEEAMDEDLAEV